MTEKSQHLEKKDCALAEKSQHHHGFYCSEKEKILKTINIKS